ncbi:MAG: hypothetical protein ACKVP3_22955 [Hyphomicrobiaceae bacterium]
MLLISIALAVTIRALSVARGNGAIDIESVQMAGDFYRNLTSETAVPRAARHERMPGQALLLTVAAVVDPEVRQGLACSLPDRTHCRPELFASVLVLQVFAAIAAFVMLLLIALRLSGSWEVALIALALSFIATRAGDFAGLVRPMAWYHFLLTLYVFLAVLAQRGSPLFALGAGLALGASVLFEPASVVLIPITAALFFLAQRGVAKQRSVQTLRAASFVCGALFGLAGFVAAASLSYDMNAAISHIALHTAERVAFNSMDAQTWVQSLIVPIPLIGDWFQSLSGLSAVKFGATRPGSIVFEGRAIVYPMSLANSETALGSVVWIVREKILGDIAAYATSTPSLICRGLWAGGGVIALFGVFYVRRMIAYARADLRIADHLIMLVPIAALFIVNTLFTSNAYWLNPILPFIYCYAIAYVASGF